MRKVLIGLVAGLALVVSVYHLILNNLIVDEEPVVSDIVIVPEGSLTGNRAQSAKTLIDEGYIESEQAIVSPLTPSNQPFYEAAGFSKDQIINEPAATSTYTNAKNTLELMDELGYESAIVTSSDYHMRRTRFIYERLNRDYDFDLTYVAAYHDQDGETVSWKNAGPGARYTASREPWKYMAYILGLYHFIDLPGPD